MLDDKLLLELQTYITKHLHTCLHMIEESTESMMLDDLNENEISHFINNHRKPTLNQVLFHFIDRTGENDAAIYHRAGINRRHFSKIRSNPNYTPKKNTLLALALALELNKDDTNDLLNAAGYSLSESDTGDLIVQFCLEKQIYDIHLVNLALDQFHLKPLTNAL